MTRLVSIPLALVLALAVAPVSSRADEEPAPKAFLFDFENTPLANVLEHAQAEKKLVFLDFYLPG